MPTLLEKPSPSTGLLPTQVLQSRHRWERWRGILVPIIIGLGVTLTALIVLHPSWQTPENIKLVAVVWVSGLLITMLAVVIAWRFAPGSLADTAQKIDKRLAAKNRLEAMAELHGSASPLAMAQREETADYLRQQPTARPVRALPWLIGGAIVLALIHIGLLGVWEIPPLMHSAPPPPPAPPKELPRASIIWKSPEPESKANPVEEVPTVAVAQSSSGFRNMSLEISVNGEPKKSQPLPAQPFDKPGKNTIKTSIYMDELDVQPFDVVSYFLRGQRITDQKAPDTTSLIQFIEVRRFRDDVAEERGMPGGNKQLNLLLELKLAQLKSMKENFILAHTDLAVTDPVRVKENDRVGKNQGDLSAKTEEVVQNFIQNGIPADIVDLLRQAEPVMTDASKKILATQNVAAVPPQGKALSLLVEAEKFFHKVMAQGPPSPPDDNPDDPFHDKQQHEMKKRFETAAGQLEQLAKNQAKIAKDVDGGASRGSSPTSSDTPDSKGSPAPGADSPSGGTAPSSAPGAANGDATKPIPLPPSQAVDPFAPDADKGTLAERQARVLQGVETLLNTNAVLPPAVDQALQDAQKDATKSLHQLDQSDVADAREPAAAAAQDLQRAVTELNKAGDTATKLAMEQAQQQLNDVAQKLKDLAKGPVDAQQKGLADLAAKVQDIQKQAADAADQQQEAGSAPGAQRLTNLANQISVQHVVSDLGNMAKNGLNATQAAAVVQRLEDLASQAALGTMPAKPSAQDIAKLVNSLEESRANLAHLAEKAGATGLTNPSTASQGQEPGKDPGQQAGAQGQGQQPGKDQGQQAGTQGQGQQPGKDPGQQAGAQGQGQQPGKDQGQQAGAQGQGQQPGKDQGQQAGTQGQGQGQQPGQNQGQGHGPGQEAGDQGQGPNQGQGPGQGQQPGQDQGQQAGTQGQDGQGQQPGGQGKGQGEQSGDHGQSQGQPQQNGTNGNSVGGTSATPGAGTGGNGPHGPGEAEEKAYHETLADMRDKVQEATIVVPAADAVDLKNQINQIYAHDAKPNQTNIVRAYQAIAPPLDKLIQELTVMVAHAQREDILKQPDMDEAPLLYRPAVSDYFESMSRDYHPDKAPDDTKKP